MPTYVVLAQLTDQGLRDIPNFVARVRENQKRATDAGVKVTGYVTMGEYDEVIIIEARDEVALAGLPQALDIDHATVSRDLATVHPTSGLGSDKSGRNETVVQTATPMLAPELADLRPRPPPPMLRAHVVETEAAAAEEIPVALHQQHDQTLLGNGGLQVVAQTWKAARSQSWEEPFPNRGQPQLRIRAADTNVTRDAELDSTTKTVPMDCGNRDCIEFSRVRKARS